MEQVIWLASASTLTCGQQLFLELRGLITAHNPRYQCCEYVVVRLPQVKAKYNTWSWCVLHMFRLIFLSWPEEPLMEKPSPESVQQLAIWICEFLNVPPVNGELWRTRIIINTGWTGRGNKVIQANFCSTNTSQCKPVRASQSAQRKEAGKTKKIHWGQCNVHFSNVFSSFRAKVEQNFEITF